jgi:hypothetical protein
MKVKKDGKFCSFVMVDVFLDLLYTCDSHAIRISVSLLMLILLLLLVARPQTVGNVTPHSFLLR